MGAHFSEEIPLYIVIGDKHDNTEKTVGGIPTERSSDRGWSCLSGKVGLGSLKFARSAWDWISGGLHYSGCFVCGGNWGNGGFRRNG